MAVVERSLVILGLSSLDEMLRINPKTKSPVRIAAL